MSRPNPTLAEVGVCALGVVAVLVIVLVAEYHCHDGWLAVSGCGIVGTIVGYMFRGARNGKPCGTVDTKQEADVTEPVRHHVNRLTHTYLWKSVPHATTRR